MRFQFSTAAQIHFGEGILGKLIPDIVSMGKVFLVIAGFGGARVEPIVKLIEENGATARLFFVQGEPDLDLVNAGVHLARGCHADVILAFGGGSVLDTGKAISGLINNPGEVIDYLEVVGAGRSLVHPGVPVIAVPTTAGTGAEVTRNAVISVPEHGVKVSIRSPHILPHMAVVDPEVTYSLPPDITASTGMDALTQLIEPFLSVRANQFTDMFCREGMRRIGGSLLNAYHDGGHVIARHEMSYASLLGGLALANAGLGAVHGFAGPIGGLYGASHGTICARLLSPVLKMNYASLLKKNNDLSLQARFQEIACLVTGDSNATVDTLLDKIDFFCSEMSIPRLRDLGVLEIDFEKIVGQAAIASSMKANPVILHREELLQILAKTW